jgi:hypothetical protein
MKNAVVLSIAAFATLANQAQAVRSYAITESGYFMSFEHSAPQRPYYMVPVAGLMPNEKLVGIDGRPATGEVYGCGSFGNIYTIDQLSGIATMVSMSSVVPNGNKFGMDFNPVPDRLRVTSNNDQNLRINVTTGVALIDGMLSYGSSVRPNIVASAYTNGVAGATSTTLYNIDSETDSPVLQSPPNDSTLVQVASLGVDVDDRTSFDIFSSNGRNSGFIVVNLPGSMSSTIHEINLATGALAYYGAFRGSDRVTGFCFDTRESRSSS